MKNDVTKKPIYKKWWFWAIIIFVVLCILIPDVNTTESAPDTTIANEDATKDVSVDSDTQDNAINATDEEPDDADTLNEEESDADKNDSKMPDETSIKLASYGVIFMGDVNNDATGNWRYATYTSDESQENIAIDYCNKYFKSENELHALINEENNTVASIRYLVSDILDVTIREYTEGEEYDAKTLFSGDLISEYFVTISTGEIEELKDEE